MIWEDKVKSLLTIRSRRNPLNFEEAHMIWEDDRSDHDAHAWLGILIALPLAVMLWTALFWGGNRIYDWILDAPCGEVRK